MVWIGQVIGQDVNLFDGPHLVATSQRDLFDSGLLPVRTPAAAYRAIALNRAPTFVVPDRLGSFQYLVAAAPVPARGRDAVLSVPLALRQREIEREIDELYRGVLVGAVIVVLFAAGLGASVAGRISDPVARLTRAARQIAAGRLDVRVVADTADELRRLVDDFNTMTVHARRAARRAGADAADQSLGADGAPGGPRDQEPADADSTVGRAPAARARGPASAARRRLRSVPDDDPSTSPAAAPDRRRVLDVRRRADGAARIASPSPISSRTSSGRTVQGSAASTRSTSTCPRTCRRCGSTGRSSRAR